MLHQLYTQVEISSVLFYPVQSVAHLCSWERFLNGWNAAAVMVTLGSSGSWDQPRLCCFNAAGRSDWPRKDDPVLEHLLKDFRSAKLRKQFFSNDVKEYTDTLDVKVLVGTCYLSCSQLDICSRC